MLWIDRTPVTHHHRFEFYFLHTFEELLVELFDSAYALLVLLDRLCVVDDAWVAVREVFLRYWVSSLASS